VSVTASSPSALCRGPGCQRSAREPGYDRADRLYCSDACRQRAYRERHAVQVARVVSGATGPEAECAELPGEECRWTPSCNADGCWRRECEQSGRPLFGTGPSAGGIA
jgi:hypothetical protein